MRHLRFLTLGLIVLFSCSRENLSVQEEGGSGEVEIQLSVSDTETGIRPQTKAVEENVPVVDDFVVEIYNSKGIRIYRAPYQEAVAAENGLSLKVNSGEYRLLAQCRDSAGIGFDPAVHAWYAADSTFTVAPQEKKTIEATAKMMKVKVKVNHGPNIVASYPEHYSVVKLIKGKNSAGELKFTKDETKSGYIPAGKLVYELYVKDPETQSLKYFHNDTTQYNPNDFVTFNVDVALGTGTTGDVTVTVKEEVDGIEKKYEIPSEAAPKDAPAITLDGFTAEKTFSFVEGVEYPGVQVNISAMGKIKSFEISSQLLANKGITASAEETLDLASATLDPAKAEALRALGFNWGRSVAGNRLAMIGLESIGLKNAYDPASLFSGEFTLKVTDELGKTATETFTLTQKLPTIVIGAEPHNAFAKRMTGITATTTDGNPDMISSLEYSLDGTVWTAVAKTGKGSEGETRFADLTGLKSDTEYKLRAIYNGNENSPSAVVTLRTEVEAQIGNAGFEEWKEWDYIVFDLIPKAYQTNYAPYLGDNRYWDTNNSETTPEKRTISNYTFKSFPMVSYVAGHRGEKAAQIMTIAISNTATPGTAPNPTVKWGKIFLGEYNYGEPNPVVEGRPFVSRPSKMNFWYKYSPCESDAFKAYVYVKNGNEIIGEGTLTSGTSISEWIEASVNIEYKRNDLQAQTIYILFESGTQTYDNGKPFWTFNVGITYGGSKTANVHGGSILTVDDVKMIYE